MTGTAKPKPQLNDLAYMRDAVLFEGPQAHHKFTRFWLLLVLASIIASAGVVADSTATVIGAMIVAPLMLPIQGTMLATVLGDRRALIRSLLLLVAGAATAVAIGFAVGLVVVTDVVAATNSQVAGRVSPGLIDLLAALATGVVGSIALVRRDISDALPGVAIAISLVPPLSVVGLTLESGAPNESWGALLLFLTNVAAIIATGIVVMAVYGAVRLATPPQDRERLAKGRRKTVIVLSFMALLIVVPLTITTVQKVQAFTEQSLVQDAADTWTADSGWEVVDIRPGDAGGDDVIVELQGEGDEPAPEDLAALLRTAGVDPGRVIVEYVPRHTVDIGAPDAD
ncbi:DUF389 domain-containing protein [Agromyces sp. NPDC058110]|uniref:DUF389 domain-containing protein n=1 Tax=Agromyces sp. NPDC058110 TaxID=3346345 RepID=UPI0036DEFCEC